MANRKKKLTKAQWALLERLERAQNGIDNGLPAAALPRNVNDMTVLITRGLATFLPARALYLITEDGMAALEARREERIRAA